MNQENTYHFTEKIPPRPRAYKPQQPPHQPPHNYDLSRNPDIYPKQGPSQQPSQQQPQRRVQPPNRELIAKMNNDFQYFAQAQTDDLKANHKDSPVPEYPYVNPTAEPEDIEPLPEDYNVQSIDDNRVTLEQNIFGEQRLASNRYPFVYKNAPFYQLPQANLIQNPKIHYLHVDSRNRNRARYPNPNHYVYPLVSSSNDIDTPGREYKNIYNITLVTATIPVLNSPLDLPYIILVIDEIEGLYDAATPQCQNAFGKLLFTVSGGKFLRFDSGLSDPIVRVYYPAPKASLAKLTISWYKPDGTLFNWGTDTTPPTPINEDLQNSFTLQITTLVPNVETALGHRNV